MLLSSARVIWTERNLFGVACAILSAGVFGTAVGMALPLLPLRLDSWGIGPAMIGINAAASSIATFVAAPRMSALVSRFSIPTVILWGIGLTTAAILAMAYTHSLTAWFVLRFILGVGVALMWIGPELWINKAAPRHLRGRVIAVYAALFAASTALGPVVLQATGLDGALPFWVCAGITLASGLPIVWARHCAPSFYGETPTKIWTVLRAAPFLLLVGAMSGLADGSAWSMLALYGLKAGLQETVAVLTSTVHLIGALAWQVPIGWLTDKMDKDRLLGLIAILATVVTAVMGLAGVQSVFFWLALFTAGGTMMGLYSVALSRIGERFEAGGMAAANSAFIMFFELGMMGGGPLSGAAMEVMGPVGLLWVMGGGCFVVVLVWPLRRRPVIASEPQQGNR